MSGGSRSKDFVIAFLVFLLLAACIELVSVEKELNTLRGEYRNLETAYLSLEERYNALSSDYLTLKSNYTQLQSEYATLQQEHVLLMLKYGMLRDAYRRLSKDVESLRDLLDSYSLTPSACPRVLSDDAIRAVAEAVTSAGVSPTDFWGSLQRIYEWIISNIEYARDVEMPYISLLYTEIDGERYVAGFTVEVVQNYVQTPKLTIELRKGDCDDQAVLAYAMIKYYMRYVLGKEKEYTLYLVEVIFKSGPGHVAVFLLLQGGYLCIIDPAGRYLTSKWGLITARPALTELQSYSEHWSSEGEISELILYREGEDACMLEARGSIEQIASFLSRS